MDNLAHLKSLTQSLIEVEESWKNNANMLEKLLDFSTDGFFIYCPIKGDFYLSDKAKIKLDLEDFNGDYSKFTNILSDKSSTLLRLEMHEILTLNKDSFRITVQSKDNRLIILLNVKVLQRNKINKPINLGGSFIIIEEF
jgi:hypothetical protein